MENNQLTACHDCDTLQNIGDIPEGRAAHCFECNAKLFVNHKGGLEQLLAIMFLCAVLFLISISFPLMSIEQSGFQSSTTLIHSSLALYDQRMEVLAFVIFFTTILSPAIVILSSLYVLLSFHFNRVLPGLKWVLVGFKYIPVWGMMDVFMLGILVTMVKLIDLANLELGLAFYSFTLLSVTFGYAAFKIDAHVLWERYSRLVNASH